MDSLVNSTQISVTFYMTKSPSTVSRLCHGKSRLFEKTQKITQTVLHSGFSTSFLLHIAKNF